MSVRTSDYQHGLRSMSSPSQNSACEDMTAGVLGQPSSSEKMTGHRK